MKTVHALPWLGLAAVGLAVALGVPPARVRVLAAELTLAAAGSGYVWLVGRASVRRARGQRSGGLRWGVRLKKPLWLRLHEPALMLAIGALLATLPAALGFPGLSIGVFLPLAVIGLGSELFSDMLTPPGLTFQEPGLRVHCRRFTILLPWNDIARIDTVGPDHFTALMVRLTDRARITASVEPATPSARRGADLAIQKEGSGASLMLMPWTAGVDGMALMQALEAARSGHIAPPALN